MKIRVTIHVTTGSYSSKDVSVQERTITVADDGDVSRTVLEVASDLSHKAVANVDRYVSDKLAANAG